jgi:hypothetical protein
MSLYIDPKNQTLLWNILHKNPIIYAVFPTNSQLSQKNKNNWFKNIISQIYSTLPQNITKEELLNVNKETLRRMINDMKPRPSETAYIPKNASVNDDFSKRQKEYELMTKKPRVEEVSFIENAKDDVIKNMDELIQEQLRSREQDLQKISKTYPSIEKRLTLDIKETIEGVPVIDLSPLNDKKEDGLKKTVSWGSNTTVEYHSLLETRIEELNKKYDDLLEYLEYRIPNFLSEFSERKIYKEILSEQIERIEGK